MKNKMYKVLTTASILAMVSIPMAVSAQDVPTVTKHNGQGITHNQAKFAPGTIGQITDFVNDKTGKYVTVTGRGLTTADQSEIKLLITKHTKIVDSKGKKVALKTIIDEQKVVKAFYGPKITKSIPAQGSALTLVVQNESFTAVNGKVTEVTDTGIVVTGKNIYTQFEDTIVLHFAKNATIMGQDGKSIKASDIKKGMSVKAFYGPAVTMSIPPQSTTNYVVVDTTVEESVQEQVPGTDGIITNVDDNKITVMGSSMKDGGMNYVILSVDKDTKIVNQDGNPLTLAALKADVLVDAYYSGPMAMSYPGQTHADKIVVKKAATNKIEGTIIGSDRTDKGQVYVNVGSDENINNDVILNITEDTKVISALGGEDKLAAGMKVVAYHSPIMTRSLPGITNAEIVIITSDKVVSPK
ncbi:peptidase [Paenibacillus antarcticus]|uniref:Peptidase n=1 Tax=Paenibacillus antarcticus TaxID=253703 RepID=A0A168Q0E4_9BACL|nr:peptidase [Paenibacillus antarcticus]OAB47251.1 peptidase [Paenibacillus antarcticus]